MAECNLWEKLAKVRDSLPKLRKDTKGYNYKYAQLDQIQEIIWPLLKEHRIYIYHTVMDMQLTTVVQDLDSSSAISSTVCLPSNPDPQKLGSAMTYFRRYNLLCLFDLETVDDDGASAYDRSPKNSYPQKAKNVDKSVDKFDPSEVIRFGKYKGKDIIQAAKDEQFVKYCDWLIRGADQKGEDPTKFVQWKDFAQGQVTIDEIPF